MMSLFLTMEVKGICIFTLKNLTKNIYITKQLRPNHDIKEFMNLNYVIFVQIVNSLDFNC